MKSILSIVSAVVILSACNSKAPEATAVPTSTVSSSDSMFVNELADSAKLQQQAAAAAATQTKTTTKRTTTGQSQSASSGVSNNTAPSSGNGTTTTAKKGWSKTAKGAVIGGVVGAGTGAVINKKNRGVGAVVGGVVGAGTGAVIGRREDKKDGRN